MRGGDHKAEELQKLFDRAKLTAEIVAVHANDLFESLRLGWEAFVNDVCQDDPDNAAHVARQQRIAGHASTFFAQLGMDGNQLVRRPG